MADHSAIQWTDATWNPTTGCTKISPGCAHCYIERTPAFRIAGRKFDKNGHISLQLHNQRRLTQPLRWRNPRRIFVNSLSDLFHDDVPDQVLHQVYHTMEAAHWHTFQVLTKRPERMRAYLQWRYGPDADTPRGRIPSRHIWHGVSVENQHFADERIPLLLDTPAAVRFISAEPLLGGVDLLLQPRRRCYHDVLRGFIDNEYPDQPRQPTAKLDWVIVGGESGPGARAFDLNWARSIIQQCHAAGVACFVKQLGAHAFEGEPENGGGGPLYGLRDRKGGDPGEWPEDLRVREYPLPRGTSQTSQRSQR